MDRQLSPEEIQDLLAAYAIDAVDDDERRQIDEYLAHDADARAEVNGFQQSASYLAHTGGPPPPGVWERLEAAIQESARPDAPAPPRLVPNARRARTPRRWQWVAAAASVVAIVFGTLWLVDSGTDSSPDSTAALAQAAEDAAGARTAKLTDAGGNVLASAVVLPDGTGYLTSDLPALPAGRTYQLWGVDDRNTISLGVMGRSPKVVAFKAAGHPAAIAVTEERAGGVPVSANQPAAVGDLQA
jgi:anti-sigma-K factor RskA